jgi:hypothetical protein
VSAHVGNRPIGLGAHPSIATALTAPPLAIRAFEAIATTSMYDMSRSISRSYKDS